MIQTLIAAVLSFIATEIDDFIVAVILFAQYSGKKQRASLVAGKYIGLAILAGGSAFLAILLSRLPHEYIGFLGLVPLALGIKSCFEKDESESADKNDDEANAKNKSALKKGAALILLSVSITIGSGGDNIGVYIPLFASLTAFEKTLTLCVYFIMQAVWCALQILTANISSVKIIISRTSRILIPIVFIILGIWILYTNGTCAWILSRL